MARVSDSFFVPFRAQVSVLCREAGWRVIAELLDKGTAEAVQPLPEGMCTGEIRLTKLPPNFGLLRLNHGPLSGEASLTIDAPPLVKLLFTSSSSSRVVRVAGSTAQYELDRDSCVVLSPSASALVFPDLSREPAGLICLLVNPLFLQSVMDDSGHGVSRSLLWLFDKSPASPTGLRVPIDSTIRQSLYQIEGCELEHPLRRVYLAGKALEVLGLTLRWLFSRESHRVVQQELSPRDQARMAQAVAIIENDLPRSPTLVELSRRLGISPVKLKRDFPAAFGVTVHGYIVDRRLDMAARLLRERDCSVKRTAYEVGYHNLSHFSLLFKQRYGLSPSNFASLR